MPRPLSGPRSPRGAFDRRLEGVGQNRPRSKTGQKHRQKWGVNYDLASFSEEYWVGQMGHQVLPRDNAGINQGKTGWVRSDCVREQGGRGRGEATRLAKVTTRFS
jgi:hypothetical protein